MLLAIQKALKNQFPGELYLINIMGRHDHTTNRRRISHGSSGGGLFDHNGKLIGITTLKFTDTGDEGIGFVIPTET